jgi:hypothetical protein
VLELVLRCWEGVVGVGVQEGQGMKVPLLGCIGSLEGCSGCCILLQRCMHDGS